MAVIWMATWRKAIVAAVAALMLASGAGVAETLYELTVVEAFDPNQDLREAYVVDINDAALGIGFATHQSFYAGFVWDEVNGKSIIPITFPAGINNLDQVVGGNAIYDVNTGVTTTIQGIGTWYIWPQLLDINDHGTAVGYIEGQGSNSDGVNQIAVIWDADGGVREPGVLAARDLVAVNNANLACGNIRWSAGDSEAYVYDINSGESVNLHELLSPSGLGTSSTADINNLGVVFGEGWNGTASQAFLWSSAGGFTYLPGLDGGQTMRVNPAGINDANQAVGSAMNGSNQWRAFLWDVANGMRDLNTLLQEPTAFILDRARAINNEGWIVGDGHFGPGNFGLARGFVLRPVAASASIEVADQAPRELRLHGNHPNPFNPFTTIRYELPETEDVRLAVYDAAGRLVRVLVDDVSRPAGEFAVHWDGRDTEARDVASGVYFIRLDAGSATRTHRAVLLR